MKLSQKEYQQMVSETSIPSPIGKDCVGAFLIGGAICTIGELIKQLYLGMEFDKDTAGILTSVSLVFLGVLFTALCLYHKLAKFGGAGTLIPITGFANAVAAPIMEFKSEGYILGIGTQFFVVAGPVISWGTIASVVYGIVYFIIRSVV